MRAFSQTALMKRTERCIELKQRRGNRPGLSGQEVGAAMMEQLRFVERIGSKIVPEYMAIQFTIIGDLSQLVMNSKDEIQFHRSQANSQDRKLRAGGSVKHAENFF